MLCILLLKLVVHCGYCEWEMYCMFTVWVCADVQVDKMLFYPRNSEVLAL